MSDTLTDKMMINNYMVVAIMLGLTTIYEALMLLEYTLAGVER